MVGGIKEPLNYRTESVVSDVVDGFHALRKPRVSRGSHGQFRTADLGSEQGIKSQRYSVADFDGLSPVSMSERVEPLHP